MRKRNLIGQVFERLTVIKEAPESKPGRVKYICQCKCGNTTTVNSCNLTSGKTKSCGCLHKEITSRAHAVDLTGKPFGKLIAIRPTEKRAGSFVVWECKCKCGRTTYVPSHNLQSGATSSCGKCGYKAELARERLTKWKTAEERALMSRFSKLVDKCYNKRSNEYPNYGGRGIFICQEWIEDRHKFVEWSLNNGFKQGLSLLRLDPDEPFAPWNCMWVNHYGIMSNNRRNRCIVYNGIEGTISNWADLLSVPKILLYQLSRVDSEMLDLQEYIHYKWNMMSIDDRETALSRLSRLQLEVR